MLLLNFDSSVITNTHSIIKYPYSLIHNDSNMKYTIICTLGIKYRIKHHLLPSTIEGKLIKNRT